MRDGWEIKKLGEVCTKLTDGSHNPPKGVAHSNYMMLSSQNVFNDKIILDDVRFLQEDDFLREDKRTCVRKGDVLLTIVGTVGRCAVFTGATNITLQRSVAVLRSQENVVPRYLMHCLIARNASLNENAHGIAQKGIYLRQLSQIPIPIPPLPLQEKIVSELDLLSSVIEKKRQQLKELDTLAHSIFYDMFGDPITNEMGWEVKKFAECYKLKSGNGLSAKDIIKGDYPVYGGNGIVGYHNEFNLEGENIIIGRVGALCGNVRNVIGQVFVTDNAFILSKNIDNYNVFLQYLLATHNLRSYAREAMQPVISNTSLKNIEIIIPPLPLQQSFAAKVEAIEQQKALIKQSLAETETLFNSRMEYYFGEGE